MGEHRRGIPVSSFQYFLWTASKGGAAATIHLYDTGGRAIGEVSFHPDGDELPPADVDDDGRVFLYYRYHSLRDVLDMLRTNAAVIEYHGPRNACLSARHSGAASPRPLVMGEVTRVPVRQ